MNAGGVHYYVGGAAWMATECLFNGGPQKKSD